VSFAATTNCVASQRVFIVVSVYFVIDSVRKLLGTPLYDGSISRVPNFVPAANIARVHNVALCS
jgi:hypothetical protein